MDSTRPPLIRAVKCGLSLGGRLSAKSGFFFSWDQRNGRENGHGRRRCLEEVEELDLETDGLAGQTT